MRRLVVALLCVLVSACGQAKDTAGKAAAPSAATALAPDDLPAFFDCLREKSFAVVAAHRGGPAPGFAENALPTFAHTVAAIPAMLEIDIARSKDGALVLMHDDTVDRTSTGGGAVADFTLAELEALQLKDDDGKVLDARIPTLKQALDWAAGKAVLELDIKRGVAYEDVAQAVRDAHAQNRVILITYSTQAAARLARVAPEMMISVNIKDASELDGLKGAGVDLAHVLAWTGTEEPSSALNIALAQRGVEVLFGTLGGGQSWDARFAREGAAQYAAFAETGIQLIATDRPVEAERDLDAHDGADGYAALQCVGAR
jgi:glycerophosphoryl diester phosphodiesterase